MGMYLSRDYNDDVTLHAMNPVLDERFGCFSSPHDLGYNWHGAKALAKRRGLHPGECIEVEIVAKRRQKQSTPRERTAAEVISLDDKRRQKQRPTMTPAELDDLRRETQKQNATGGKVLPHAPQTESRKRGGEWAGFLRRTSPPDAVTGERAEE